MQIYKVFRMVILQNSPIQLQNGHFFGSYNLYSNYG